MFKFILMACFVALCCGTICGPKDFHDFEGCMNDTMPHKGPDDFKACFTKNNCSVPEMKPHNGSSEESGEESGEKSAEEHMEGSHIADNRGWSKSFSKGGSSKGTSKESFAMFSGNVNGSVVEQCIVQLRKNATNDIKVCVQTKYNSPTFDFPQFEGGMHKEGKGKGKGKSKGQFKGPAGFNKTQCPAEKDVRSCIEGLFNESAVCTSMESCKAKASCSLNETEEAICKCAKSTVEENGSKYEAAFFACIGQEKPKESKMYKMMQEKAVGEFCRRHDEDMPMCGGKGKGKGKVPKGKSAKGSKGSKSSKGSSAKSSGSHKA